MLQRVAQRLAYHYCKPASNSFLDELPNKSRPTARDAQLAAASEMTRFADVREEDDYVGSYDAWHEEVYGLENDELARLGLANLSAHPKARVEGARLLEDLDDADLEPYAEAMENDLRRWSRGDIYGGS